MSVVRDIRAMWSNGTRLLLIAFALLLVTVALFVGVSILAYVVLNKQPYEPLVYQSPQHVLNLIVHPGETVKVEAYKCNVSGQDLVVDGQPYYRNLDTGSLTPRPGDRLDGAVLSAGCPLRHFANPLPPDLPPGHYRLEGVDTTTNGMAVQREGWESESFCLTDAQGGGC